MICEKEGCATEATNKILIGILPLRLCYAHWLPEATTLRKMANEKQLQNFKEVFP